MQKRRSNLVCQHLERISAGALEDYQDIIREEIRGRHGIYALYKRDRLYYVGLARSFSGRLKSHLRDRHKGLWDRFSVYVTIEGHHIKELESLVLRIVKPKGNAMIGRLSRAEDMKRKLVRAVRLRQREEIRVLIGKQIKITRVVTTKRLIANRVSETILGRCIDKPFTIRGTHKGKTYRARVRRTGWISYKGYLYSSPSQVAREICGHHKNGWIFWEWEKAPNYWVKLKALKK
jgi:hypothetical protein